MEVGMGRECRAARQEDGRLILRSGCIDESSARIRRGVFRGGGVEKPMGRPWGEEGKCPRRVYAEISRNADARDVSGNADVERKPRAGRREAAGSKSTRRSGRLTTSVGGYSRVVVEGASPMRGVVTALVSGRSTRHAHPRMGATIPFTSPPSDRPTPAGDGWADDSARAYPSVCRSASSALRSQRPFPPPPPFPTHPRLPQGDATGQGEGKDMCRILLDSESDLHSKLE
ncbi:hypothetical protein DFH08DRAFT_808313 [Mycena albidolilacea]|uniref:Uncharacterized protein n=1 Tax=Mycena albidolilacea TaxID=1033008 RepID=A0AAD7ETU7_9AGAR|nr:hypothetical protein DFH08DRAFT_808313 [Mycena albidolilacea]